MRCGVKPVECWCHCEHVSPPPPVLAADASSNAAQEQEAQALLNKRVIILCELFGSDRNLLHLGQAQAVWEELVYRFKKSKDHNIQEQVANARHNLHYSDYSEKQVYPNSSDYSHFSFSFVEKIGIDSESESVAQQINALNS
ncbi:MAG: hypothetical protein J6P29_06795 [Acetobacter sp.]|nr:hypothetical protein [Acetobacter sp.]